MSLAFNISGFYDKLRLAESKIDPIPEGWITLFKQLDSAIDYLNIACDAVIMGGIHIVDNSNGYMRVVYDLPVDLFKSPEEHLNYQNILDRLCWSIERTSAVTCTICSKKGFRRQLKSGIKTLCHSHYVEQLNKESKV